MSETEKYREGHDQLLNISKEISTLLIEERISRDPKAVRRGLSKLAAKLRVHLLLEDKSLYPILQSHSDEKVRALANRFVYEMGGISDAFNAYMFKWSASAIKENAASFINETKSLFDVLSKRIHKENTELYAMVDQLN
jgi:hemerythrin-like domain-containing protein